MRRFAAALILIVTFALSSHAIAGPFESAEAAYRKGDYKTAHRLFRQLVEQGFARAQHNVGVMYAEGRGVVQDYVTAYMWFDLAAARAPENRLDDSINALKNRENLASKMTPDQVAEAQRRKREWKPKTRK
jgi:TPR repeat protein